MKKLAALAMVLAFAGCKKKEEAPASGSAGSSGSAAVVATGSGSAGSGSAGSGSAADETPPPYTPAADVPDAIKAVIAAPDRSVKDRMLDAGRMPGETFAFFKIAPGQKVQDLFAGGGYSTEMLARIVGDTGKVWAQNSPEIAEKFARVPLTERLAKPVNKNVTAVELPTEAPFAPDAKDLDAVISIINYHDYVNEKVDRAKLNAAVFAALKPGGVYGIVDSSAEKGSGLRDTDTLHRIDEEAVKQEVQAAGFKLDAESDALRHPDDKRDWNTSPRAAGARRGQGDKFALRFVKPAK